MATAIHIQGLGKKYGSFEALAPLDLEVKQGEILGYLGPNGAGKTTTIRALLGLIKPTSGRAEIFGLDTQRDKVAAHRRLAYVPGEATFWPSLTGGGNAAPARQSPRPNRRKVPGGTHQALSV